MNEQSQIGITIAGVAVVSAIAAVAFNKLNVEPRLSRSNQYEEKADDNYEGDEGVDPPDRPWSLKNAGNWDRLPSKFDESSYIPAAPSAPPRPSFDSTPPYTPVAPSAPPRPSFGNDFEELEPERPEPSAPPRPSFPNDFQSPSESSVRDESQSSQSVPPVPPGQGAMMGGARHTRCKHCHSRLKYTRKNNV